MNETFESAGQHGHLSKGDGGAKWYTWRKTPTTRLTIGITLSGDAAQWYVSASEFKSEDPGFDPLAGQGEDQYFCPPESPLIQPSLCLPPPPPLRVYGTHTYVCAR